MGNIKFSDDEQKVIVRLLENEAKVNQDRIKKIRDSKKMRAALGMVETPNEEKYRERSISNAENQIAICWNAIEKVMEGQYV